MLFDVRCHIGTAVIGGLKVAKNIYECLKLLPQTNKNPITCESVVGRDRGEKKLNFFANFLKSLISGQKVWLIICC
jgi:hypothetical protein